jgi:hypothetical protein
MARDEHALDRSLALRRQPLEPVPSLGDARRLRPQAPALRRGLRERAVCPRDGALGIAQRVARLVALGLLAFQLLLQRLDAAAQCPELLLVGRRDRGGRREQRGEEEQAGQAFAFPWADTAAMRRSTSPGSPR